MPFPPPSLPLHLLRPLTPNGLALQGHLHLTRRSECPPPDRNLPLPEESDRSSLCPRPPTSTSDLPNSHSLTPSRTDFQDHFILHSPLPPGLQTRLKSKSHRGRLEFPRLPYYVRDTFLWQAVRTSGTVLTSTRRNHGVNLSVTEKGHGSGPRPRTINNFPI